MEVGQIAGYLSRWMGRKLDWRCEKPQWLCCLIKVVAGGESYHGPVIKGDIVWVRNDIDLMSPTQRLFSIDGERFIQFG